MKTFGQTIINESRRALNDLEEHLLNRQAQIEELTAQVRQQHEELAKLNQELSRVKACSYTNVNAELVANLQAVIDRKDEENKRLREDLNRRTSDYLTLDKAYQQMAREKGDAIAELATIRADQKISGDRYGKLYNDYQDALDKIAKLEATNMGLLSEKVRPHESTQRQARTENELQAELDKLRAQIKAHVTLGQSQEAQIKRLETANKNQLELIERLHQQVESLNKKIEHLNFCNGNQSRVIEELRKNKEEVLRAVNGWRQSG